jgi:hypothetical protein
VRFGRRAPESSLQAGCWRRAKIQVESKDDLRKAERFGRSTDASDAVVEACYDRAVDMEYLELGVATTPMEGEHDTNPLMAKTTGPSPIRLRHARRERDLRRVYRVAARGRNRALQAPLAADRSDREGLRSSHSQ